jgi:endonuclease-8
MPEGPSIVIFREAAAKFRGKTVRKVSGSCKLDLGRMEGRRVIAVRSWGKHFLLAFRGFSLRVHMLMFGTYRIDDRKPARAQMSLRFDNGELNVYTSSLKYVEGALEDSYDWRADVMDSSWDPALARRKLKAKPDMLACDALLDQDIFAGVGNIIKNEVLFRIALHPESRVDDLPPRKLGQLIAQASQYSFDFLEWKQQYVLREHWLVHTRRSCPTCGSPLLKRYLGVTHRRTFFCEQCQIRY